MGTLSDFARTADAVCAAPGKLEKTRLLAEFFSLLPDVDLRQAAVYFTGLAFPSGSGRVLQVGFAQLQAAVLTVSGAAPDALAAEYLRWSDVGDAVRAVFGERPSAGLSLADLGQRFDALAATAAGLAKTAALTRLIAELDAAEARYVAKIVTGDLRIGLKEGLVEEAVARAFGAKLADVRRA